jgi:tetratricopeptide (TPR) repeat protein
MMAASIESRPHRRKKLVVGIGLFILTLAVFWPVVHCGFVEYDDNLYVTSNAHVQAGLTWDGVIWAFGRLTGESTYWHPLTWLSHMLDYQLFGLNAGYHHLINLLFHASNALLLFIALEKMTGSVRRSAWVAALFALHPLQVDTVAWVAERKNVLSAFFWIATILFYARYVKETSQDSNSRRFTYALMLLMFVLGLMAKPVLVTLPCVLLLLDFWPLRRTGLTQTDQRADDTKTTWGRLLLEKSPLFLLSAVSSAITFIGHQRLGLLASSDRLGFQERAANALISYVRYLGKTVWPSNLSVFYPYPPSWPFGLVFGAGLLLAIVTGLIVIRIRKLPYLATGWFWFLGTLAPTIGLIQASDQAIADRFMYVPLIGLFIMMAWAIPDLSAGWSRSRWLMRIGSVVILAACALFSSIQIQYWKNSGTLFAHAASVTRNNYLAYAGLGSFFSAEGNIHAAIVNFRKALDINPRFAQAWNNLGIALNKKGDAENAKNCFMQALDSNPRLAETHVDLAILLTKEKRLDEAIVHYRAALELRPGDAQAHNNLGIALAAQGKSSDALRHFAEAVRLNPQYAKAQNNFANALAEQGKLQEAAAHYLAAIQLQPLHPDAHFNLGMVLVRQGRQAEATREFGRTLQLKPDYVEAQRQLDAMNAASSGRP